VYTLALNAVCSYENFEAEMRRLNRRTSLVPWDELDGKLRGKLEKDVEVATDVTRAEIMPVIKSLYTHGQSPSPTCCDFDEIEYILVDTSKMEYLMMKMVPLHVYYGRRQPYRCHILGQKHILY
jgi:hypothetical protein